MEVIELHPDLHMLDCPVGHVYLWHGDDGLTLIDSSVPGTARQIAAAVQTLGYRRHQQ